MESCENSRKEKLYVVYGMTGVRLITVLCLLLHTASGSAVMKTDENATSLDPFGICLFLILPLSLSIMCLWASRRSRRWTVDGFGLLGRSLNTMDASMIMICIWVCGGYMFGSAESVVTPGRGLIWAQAPWCYSISFFISSLLFCNVLRGRGYLTLFNAFSEVYAGWVAALFYIPSFCGEVCWLAVSLSVLGQAFSALLGVSKAFSMTYILIMVLINIISGGMFSLKRTCKIEVVIMIVSFLIVILVIVNNPLVNHIGDYSSQWLVPMSQVGVGEWIDMTLMLTFGGTCWQCYYQICLACNSVETANTMSIVSGIGTLLCGSVACFCGIAATAVDWSAFPAVGTLEGKESQVMTLVLMYLVPTPVRYLAVLATTALTSSSIAGAIFSSATTFSINVYKGLIRPQARDGEVITAWRVFMIVMGGIGLALAMVTDYAYAFWVFSSDFIYISIFPQLLLAVWLPTYTNLYGSLSAFLLGAVLRYGAGEYLLGIPCWIQYPSWLPYRLMIVIVTILVSLLISAITRYFIEIKGWQALDILQVYHARPGSSGRWSRKYSHRRLQGHSHEYSHKRSYRPATSTNQYM